MNELDHNAALRLIDAYFAGELEREKVEQMRAHLRDCDDCRASFDKRGAAAQSAVGSTEADRLADARVWEAVRADPAVQSKRPVERRWWPAP